MAWSYEKVECVFTNMSREVHELLKVVGIQKVKEGSRMRICLVVDMDIEISGDQEVVRDGCDR